MKYFLVGLGVGCALAVTAAAQTATPTGPVELQNLPNCSDAGGAHLNYSATTGLFTCGGTGSIASVGLSMPGTFSVTGSPITSGSGTLTVTLQSQAQGLVFASPPGSSGAPGFRALAGTDMPLPGASSRGGVDSLAAVAHQFVTGLGTDGILTTAQPAASDLSNGTTGSGAVVLASSPTLASPTFGAATIGSAVSAWSPSYGLSMGIGGFQQSIGMSSSGFGYDTLTGSNAWAQGAAGSAMDARPNMFQTYLAPASETTNVWENFNSFVTLLSGTSDAEINLFHAAMTVSSGATVASYGEGYEASLGNSGTIYQWNGSNTIANNNSGGIVTSALYGASFVFNNYNSTAGSVPEYDALHFGGMGGGGSYPTHYSVLRSDDSHASVVIAGGLSVGIFGNYQSQGTVLIRGPDTSSTAPFSVQNSTPGNILTTTDGGSTTAWGFLGVRPGAQTAQFQFTASDHAATTYGMNGYDNNSNLIWAITDAGTAIFGNSSDTTVSTVMTLINSAATCTLAPTASSMTPSCSSDAKFKTDIKPAWWNVGAIFHVWSYPIRTFRLKSDGSKHLGVVAQELQKVHPEMVHTFEQRDQQGNITDSFLTVDEPNPWLVMLAVQQLLAFAVAASFVAGTALLWHAFHHRRHALTRREIEATRREIEALKMALGKSQA